MNKISVQILAGNCADIIERCLNSVKDIADEIIIVLDTRHGDNTNIVYDILCQWIFANGKDLKIYRYDWESDSFADARNFGLSKATGEWIVYIDTDEELVNFEMPDDRYDYYMSTITKEDIRFRNIRIFKNKFKFRDARHNRLDTVINEELLGSNDTVFAGFTKTSHEDIIKKTRSLLKRHIKQLEDEPDNLMLHFYICRCHFELQEWEATKETGHLALQDPLEKGHWAMVMLYLYIAYRSTGRAYAAKQWLDRSLALLPEQIWGWCLLLEELHNKKDTEGAEQIRDIILNTTVTYLPQDMNEKQVINLLTSLNLMEYEEN
jgi:glycosyltransferase involved in cell wall biosynthesis